MPGTQTILHTHFSVPYFVYLWSLDTLIVNRKSYRLSEQRLTKTFLVLEPKTQIDFLRQNYESKTYSPTQRKAEARRNRQRCSNFNIFISVAQARKAGLSRLIVEAPRSHTQHDPSERVISSLQRHNLHNTQTSMPSAEFETATSVIKRLQIYALHGTATGIGV
jgi:hypothetical protein